MRRIKCPAGSVKQWTSPCGMSRSGPVKITASSLGRGDAETSIKTSVDVDGGHLTGTVYTALPHAVFLHEGTPPHVVVPRTKMALRWSDGGSFVFAKRSQVAGIQGDPYLYNALAEERASIVSRFEAIGGLLKE